MRGKKRGIYILASRCTELFAPERDRARKIDSLPSIFAHFVEGNAEVSKHKRWGFREPHPLPSQPSHRLSWRVASSPISANLKGIAWDSTAVVPNRQVVCHLTHLVVVYLGSSQFPPIFRQVLWNFYNPLTKDGTTSKAKAPSLRHPTTALFLLSLRTVFPWDVCS